MQRIGILLPLALALMLMGSLFLVWRHFDQIGSSPRGSAPGDQGVSQPAGGVRASVRRWPTVLSPDLAGDDIPNVVSPASHDATEPDAGDETKALSDPVGQPRLQQPDVPVRLLPMRESLIPIPGPYESAPLPNNAAEAGSVSGRPREDTVPR